MKSPRKALFLKIALVGTIAVALFGKVVQELWNWLMPGIFGLTAVTFWQALGLMALSWLLVGGGRGFRGWGPRHRSHWRARVRERWERMTPEERDKFREGIRGRC